VRRDSSVLFLVLAELLTINASLSFHHIAKDNVIKSIIIYCLIIAKAEIKSQVVCL
jgi:hypothetical protein